MTSRALLAGMFLLTVPHAVDVRTAKRIGLGGLRHCASKTRDSQRPWHLFPTLQLDPLSWGDQTQRPLVAIWAEHAESSAAQRAAARAEHCKRNRQQVDIFRQALSDRRNAKQGAILRRAVAERRAAKAASAAAASVSP